MYGQYFNSKAERQGTGVNAPLDEQGRTALHFAVEEGNIREIEKLLRIGAKANQQDNGGESPLFTAVRKKDEAAIALLLGKGATFSLRSDSGETALDAALATAGDPVFIEKLAALGAQLEAPEANTRTSLHLAVEKGAAPAIVEYLVAQGIDVNATDNAGRTPLHLAIEQKNAAVAEKLLSLGADPVARDASIATPLHYAARSGDASCADLLLAIDKVRAHVNDYKTYQEGWTPLMIAVVENNAELVAKIASVGGDANKTDNQNRNALFLAAEYGSLTAAKTLLDHGADAGKSAESTSNRSSMVHWVNAKNYAEMMLLLHQAGIDLNARDGSGQTALHKACDSFDKEKIRVLIDLGANPDIANEFGKRPLDLLIDHYGYEMHQGDDMVALLLKNRANPGLSPSPSVRSAPLHVAASAGRTETVKLLLKHNAEVNVTERSEGGMTPFLLACEYGHAAAAQALLAAGADPLRQDRLGRTALHYAAISGNIDVANLMFAQKGIDIDAKDAEGKSPLHHTTRLERAAVAERLLQLGAHPSAYDNAGMTPLHLAVEANSNNLVTLLLEQKNIRLDINMPTRDEGHTCLHIAVRDNAQMLLSRLLELGADPARVAKNGLLPLHYAILHDRPSMAETLMAAMKRRKVNFAEIADRNGWTPLHYAATRDTPQMASQLIAAGVDINAKSTAGDTALHIAVRTGKTAVVEYLIDTKSADMFAANSDGDTPASLALKSQDDNMKRTILQKLAEAAEKAAAAAQNRKTGKPPAP